MIGGAGIRYNGGLWRVALRIDMDKIIPGWCLESPAFKMNFPQDHFKDMRAAEEWMERECANTFFDFFLRYCDLPDLWSRVSKP